ncbi:hypothetical protein NQ317_013292 [Molorchus minor]|uniref:THAP-type domain-containing protein n=1 Tax=Molorchus minor TaxID=1323400 RepID=A0ABQ9JQW7_9CUCU|nr:hypothetical protein NQ317_013292 [Molorchus minor]
MPGQICAVALCKSNRLTLKKEGVNLAFHRFPKGNDVGSSTIRKQWINRCKRKDKFNPNTSSICGLHFTTNDYERDLQNELLGLPLRQVLKKTAVPTLNLNESKNTPEKPIEGTPSCKRPKKKKNMDPVESLLTNASLSNPESSQLLDLPSTSSAMPSSYTEISEDPRTSYTQDTYKQKKDLQFDEDKVKSLEEIGLANDQVLGPHSQLQVMQARDLLSK